MDTTPRWLSLTLASSSGALVASGLGVFLGLAEVSTITPFTLLLHLVWAISIAAWVLNLKTKLPPEKRALLAIGVTIAVGSAWSSIQQFLAYYGSGTANDILLVGGAMMMDAAGGAVTFVLFHLNILKKKSP